MDPRMTVPILAPHNKDSPSVLQLAYQILRLVNTASDRELDIEVHTELVDCTEGTSMMSRFLFPIILHGGISVASIATISSDRT